MSYKRPKIICIGNAITDVISLASEQFLIKNDMIKNAMNLIDYERSKKLMN